MTKRELEQIAFLKSEIRRDKERLARLRSKTLTPSMRFSEISRCGVCDSVADLTVACDELERLIQVNMDSCIKQVLRAQRFINTVEDSRLRLMLVERYIRCKSWLQVAFAASLYDGDAARKRVERFLSRSC